MSFKDKEVLHLLESLPRLIQLTNSIAKLNDNDISKSKYKSLLKRLKLKSTSIHSASKCRDIPSHDINSSLVNIIFIPGKNTITFSLRDADSFRSDGDFTLPTKGDKLYMEVQSYFNLANGLVLTPYQSSRQYSPSILIYTLNNYLPSVNLGEAFLSGPTAKLLLKDRDDIIREYKILDVGKRIKPNIYEAYLIK